MRLVLQQHGERAAGSSREGGSSSAGTQSPRKRDRQSLPFAELLQQADSILSSFARHQQPLQQICEETLGDISKPSADLVCQLVDGAQCHESLLIPLVDAFLSAHPVGSLRRHRRAYQVICYMLVFLLPEIGNEMFKGFVCMKGAVGIEPPTSGSAGAHLSQHLAYANPVTMQLLLEFVFDEEALRKRVFPRWLELYESDYVEARLLPLLRERARQVEGLLQHLRKEADCSLLSAASKPTASALKAGLEGLKDKRETASNRGGPQPAGRKGDEGDRAPELKPPQRRHTAAVFSPARETTAKAGAPSVPQVGRRSTAACAAACRPERASAPAGSAGAAQTQPEAQDRDRLDPPLEETPPAAETVAVDRTKTSRTVAFSPAAATETVSATECQDAKGLPSVAAAPAAAAAVAPAAAAVAAAPAADTDTAAAATAAAAESANEASVIHTERSAVSAEETGKKIEVKGEAPERADASLERKRQTTVPHPFELSTDKRPTKLAALLQAAEDTFLSLHTFCPRLRPRRSPKLSSKTPSTPVRHTVSSLLRAEKLLLQQEERRPSQEETEAGEEDSKELEAEEARRRVLRLKVQAETARRKALEAAAEQRSRKAAAARSQRQKEIQWLEACRSSEKQRLLLQQERQGTTSREARRRATLALQQDSIPPASRMRAAAAAALVVSKRVKAERLKRDREKMRRAASRASQEGLLKRRVAASHLRGLVAASSVVARMRRAAAVSVSKDFTCSGPLQQLSLDSKCLLEVRLRAELLKRRKRSLKSLKLKETTLQRADAAALRAAARVRSSSLRRDIGTAAAAPAVAGADVAPAAAARDVAAEAGVAAAADSVAAALLEKKQRQWESRAALKQEEIERQISQEYFQSTRQATQQTVRQQLMRGLERAALSRQLMRVAQQEAEETLREQEQKQRRQLRETERQAAAERRHAQQQAFNSAREQAAAFLAENTRQKKERVAAMRAREGRQRSPSIAEGLVDPAYFP
ncbi:hypothetical protein Emed_001097 [Eimeria media]